MDKEITLKSGPADYITLSDVSKSFVAANTEAFENGIYRPQAGKIKRFAAGFTDAVLEKRKLKDSVMIFGGQGAMAVGGVFGEDNALSSWGKELVRTGSRQLSAIDADNAKKGMDIADYEKETFAYKLGAGFESVAEMLLVAYATGGVGTAVGLGTKAVAGAKVAAGVAAAGAQELSGEVQEGVQNYQERTGDKDLAQYNAKEAAKEFATTAGYTVAAGALEKVNLGKIMPFLKEGKKPIVNFFKGGISEGLTEGAQELANIGFDLVDGTIDFSKMPERLYGMFEQAVIGGVVGGTTAGAFSVYNRAKIKNYLRDDLANVVPEKDLNAVVNAVYDAGVDTMAGIVTTELSHSESLRNKHGDIYRSMMKAIDAVAAKSKAFGNEQNRAAYVSETAAMFADQVLAEANARKVSIDSVLKASDIVYEDGGIKFKTGTQTFDENGQVLEQAMYRSKVKDIKDFYNVVISGQEARPIYFQQNIGDVSIDIPSDTIRHDFNKHGITETELSDVFEALEKGAINEAYYGDYQRYNGAPVKMAVDVNGVEYGVSFEHLKNGRNILGTVFKLTDRTWLKKTEAQANPSYPDSKSRPLGHSVKDIISEIDADDKQVLEQAMYRSKMNNVGDFYDSVVNKTDERPRYYAHTTSEGVELSLPDYIINHDVNRHALTRGEIEMVFDNIENIEAAGVSNKKTDFAENSVLLKINTPNGSYGVTIALGKNQNFITTMFKSTGKKGVDAWMENESSAVPSNQPTVTNGNAKFVAPRSSSLKDIIGQVREKINTDNGELNQNRGGVKGSFNPSERIIKITRNADYSTLPHEFAHFWLNEMQGWVNSGLASDEYLARHQIAMDWLGVEDGKPLTRRAHEQFARGYEQYLLNGNLPDSPMNPLFKEYDRWLKQVYDDMNQPSKKPLTTDMVRFFQSMTTGELPATVSPPVNVADQKRREESKTPYPNIDTSADTAAVSEPVAGGLTPLAVEADENIGKYSVNGDGNIYNTFVDVHEKAGLVEKAPERFTGETKEDILNLLHGDKNGVVHIKTPVENVKMQEGHFNHLLNDNEPQRKGFLNHAVATLERPNLIVKNGRKHSYIKLFNDSNSVKPHLQIVKVAEDGSFYVTNFRPTKSQINSIIKEGQVIFDLSDVRSDVKTSPATDNIANANAVFNTKYAIPAAVEAASGKVSAANERQNRLNKINGSLKEDVQSVFYDPVTLEGSAQQAEYLLEKNGVDGVRAMIDGEQAMPDNVLRTAVLIAYEQEMLKQGNIGEYTRVLRKHTLEQTRRGQEISAERLNQDITNPSYWAKQVLLGRKNTIKDTVFERIKRDGDTKEKAVDRFVAETAAEYAEKLAAVETVAEDVLSIDTAAEMNGMTQEEFDAKSIETLKSLKGQKVFNSSLNGEIEIRKSSIKKYKSFLANKDKRLIIPYVSDLLRKARFSKTELPYTKRETSIKAYHKAVLPVIVDGKSYDVRLTVREDQFGNFFWDAQIEKNLQKTTPATNPGGLEVASNEADDLNITLSDGNSNTETKNDKTSEIIRELNDKIQSITGEQMELFQKESIAGKAYDAVYDEIGQWIEECFDVAVSEQEMAMLTEKVDELGKIFAKGLKPGKNPSVEAMAKIKEMRETVAAMNPTNWLSLAVNSYGRAAMLAGVKSTNLNILSNAETYVTEAIARRIVSGSYEKAVDVAAVKAYLDYDFDVFKKSGVMMSVVRPDEILNPAKRLIGEDFISSAGDGNFRKGVRFMERLIFDWSLGAPDAKAKALSFVDNAALEATKIAKAEGLTGEALKKRATELFNDAVLYQPRTAQGTSIRNSSINAAEVATFTNDGKIAQMSGKVRNLINAATGKARLGDFVMPFVKTPANVVALGMEYSFGLGTAALHLPQILSDVRAGTLSDVSRSVIRSSIRNGIGLGLAALIASLFDADDYIPAFALASAKERDLVRFKNGVYNSIKIGGKYVSLDCFGPLAAPLVGVLEAKKAKETVAKASAFVKAALSQVGNIPGLKEISNLTGWIDKATTQPTEKTIEDLWNGVTDQIIARTIPAIVGDIAKAVDPYERVSEDGIVGSLAGKIPVAREALSAKADLSRGQEQQSENPLMTLLFGARVKTAADSAVATEINRLGNAGEFISLTDVAKSKAFDGLTDKGKARLRLDFAKGFTNRWGNPVDGFTARVGRLIKTEEYQRKTDAEKKDAINKIRRKVLRELVKSKQQP